MYFRLLLGGSEAILAGIDLSEGAAPTDRGRAVRILLDAGRRGVAGKGAIVLCNRYGQGIRSQTDFEGVWRVET